MHPEQVRILTIQESARLQGFPDFYRFCGTVKDKCDGYLPRDINDVFIRYPTICFNYISHSSPCCTINWNMGYASHHHNHCRLEGCGLVNCAVESSAYWFLFTSLVCWFVTFLWCDHPHNQLLGVLYEHNFWQEICKNVTCFVNVKWLNGREFTSFTCARQSICAHFLTLIVFSWITTGWKQRTPASCDLVWLRNSVSQLWMPKLLGFLKIKLFASTIAQAFASIKMSKCFYWAGYWVMKNHVITPQVPLCIAGIFWFCAHIDTEICTVTGIHKLEMLWLGYALGMSIQKEGRNEPLMTLPPKFAFQLQPSVGIPGIRT